MSNNIRLEFASLPENVALARLVVASLASQAAFTLSDIEELKVAISEAVSNAIIHGYAGSTTGRIALEAYVEGTTLIFTVTDDGNGIADIAKAMEPSFSTQPDRMGLGFVFMQSFMDTVSVESEPQKGTKVTMTKKAGSIGDKPDTPCN